MTLRVNSAPLTIKRGRTFFKPSAAPPCMVDNRFIEVLDGRDPITLFQPAHSVMQAGVGPIGRLTRGLCRERGVGGPVQGDPALQILHSLYPIRKAFMQGRHVGHGIISTGDCRLARSRDCLTGTSEQGEDTPSSSAKVQVDNCQKSHEGMPKCFCRARARPTPAKVLVSHRMGKSTGLCWSRALPKKRPATRHTVV